MPLGTKLYFIILKKGAYPPYIWNKLKIGGEEFCLSPASWPLPHRATHYSNKLNLTRHKATNEQTKYRPPSFHPLYFKLILKNKGWGFSARQANEGEAPTLIQIVLVIIKQYFKIKRAFPNYWFQIVNSGSIVVTNPVCDCIFTVQPSCILLLLLMDYIYITKCLIVMLSDFYTYI